MHRLARLLPDPFTLALLGTVLLASLFPARGAGAEIVGHLGTAAIALLFFLHGARLSREAIMAGIVHWRLHLVILASTFVLFPIVGWALSRLLSGLMPAEIWLGVLFVCTLPSTVQSSIAFTSIARGNVPAAICAATASNMIGIVVTPLLATLVLKVHGAQVSLSEVWKILLQLVVPFAAGNLVRPWIARWAERNKKLLSMTDRGSILLIVYAAFSEAVVQGIWHQFPPLRLASLVAVNAVLLGSILLTTALGSRALGFNREDEIAIVFCGSKKSMATGIPMASVLFSGATVGLIVLPLMIFHQMQLMVCAILARRYAQRHETGGARALTTAE